VLLVLYCTCAQLQPLSSSLCCLFWCVQAEAHVNSLLETLDNVEWPDDEAGKTAKAIVRDGGVKAHMARHSSMSGFTK